MLQYFRTISFFNKNIKIFEYSLKEYKSLLKSLLGIKNTPQDTLSFLQNFLQLKTDLSHEQVEKLDFISFFLILFYLKCTSSSGLIKAETTHNNAKTAVTLDVTKFITYLSSINIDEILFSDKLDDDTVIEYALPSINDVISYEDPQELVTCFISSVRIKTSNINFQKYPYSKKKALYDKLPLKVAYSIKKRADNIISYFNNINLLDTLTDFCDAKLYFNFNKDNLIHLIKLLFEDNLLTIYQNQFLLAKHGNIEIAFLENCTPGEYNIFIENLNKEFKDKNEN